MARSQLPKISLDAHLGLLAMQFRSKRDESARNALAGQYADVVKQLIDSGKWRDMPTIEEMLPGEQMPPVFFIFWSIPSPFPITVPESAKPTLIIEGREDAAILRAILPPRVAEVCKLRPTQGRQHLAASARTHV